MGNFTAGAWDVNFDAINVSVLLDVSVQVANSTTFRVQAPDGTVLAFTGSGFTYAVDGTPTGGTVTGLQEFDGAEHIYSLTNVSVPVSSILGWVQSGDNEGARVTVFSGADVITGSQMADLMRGYAGADTMTGNGGSDTLWGGAGDDVMSVSTSGYAFMWAEAGNDSISGGSGWDNTHGNQGNDTIHGNDGADWVVGGQGSDLLYGDLHADLVYGNMGADTLYGGDGDDRLLGGQDNDTLAAGGGDDFVSGDRGADTVSGGGGADSFYGFTGTGVDRVTDFNYAEGDRVLLAQTTAQSIAVVGNDTVVSFGSGDQLVLVGVTSALPADFVIVS
jgi:serralysin